MSRLVGSVLLALLVLSDIDAGMASDRTVSGTRASGPRATHSSFVIREHLQATVSDVDRTIDVVRLKTDAGRLTLHVLHFWSRQVNR